MSPSDIEVLLHCHCCPEPHPRRHAPAVGEAIERFLRLGLIKPWGEIAGRYITTDGGAKLVDMLCETPMPEMAWVDPRANT